MSAEISKTGPPVGSTTPRLPLLTKLVYGSGDWGMASLGTLRQIFYAIFLTDVVGLNPGLASFAALFGVIWDAINDPLVGVISDRVHTRWGRRRPFLLFFSVPYALGFLLLWWAPPWESQVALMVTVTLAFMISDTFQTLLIVEEVARFLFVWLTFVGASFGLLKGLHLGMDMLVARLKPGTRNVVECVNALITLAFLGVWIVGGVHLIQANLDYMSPATGFSMGLVYMIGPLAAVLMGVETIGRLGANIKTLRRG